MSRQDMLNNDLLASIHFHDMAKAESLILQGADVNASDVPGFSGYTPLMCAIDANDVEMIKLLLRHGADADKKVFIAGTFISAFQYARGSGKGEIADLLEFA